MRLASFWLMARHGFILFSTLIASLWGLPTVVASVPAPRFQLNIHLTPSARHMDVRGTVRLAAPQRLQDGMEFELADSMHDLHMKVTAPGSATAATVESEGKDGRNQKYRLHFPEGISVNEPLLVDFSYQGGEQPSLVFSLGPEASFADGDDTAWYPQFENSGRAEGEIQFNVPEGYTVAASGEEKGAGVFHISNPQHLCFAVGKYSRVEIPGTVPVTAFLLKPRREVQQKLGRLSEILARLSKEFGPYPHDRFSIVEVPDEQAESAGFGGASSDGIILVGNGALNAPLSLPYYGHELSHQWWGNLVTSGDDGFGQYMLSEGLAQYGALVAVEALEGTESAGLFRRKGILNGDSRKEKSLES